MKAWSILLSIGAISACFVVAQLMAEEKSADTKTDSARTHHFRASAIEGMAVRNHSGDDLGKVKDLIIDLETGKVVYAALDFGGFIGIGDKLFAVPWNAFKCETSGKVEHLVLAIPKEKLKNAPGFDKSHWPAVGDPAWSKIDQFYALPRTTKR